VRRSVIWAAVSVVAVVAMSACEPVHVDESREDWLRRREREATALYASPPEVPRPRPVRPVPRVDVVRQADCRAVVQAVRFVMEYEIQGVRGFKPWSRERWDSDLASRLATVPEGLRDEVGVFRLGAQAYAHELDGYLNHDREDLDGQFDRAEATLRTREVGAALSTIKGFLGTCPSW
jgi:hypothetical protein